MKPKPRSLMSFLIVPRATVTSACRSHAVLKCRQLSHGYRGLTSRAGAGCRPPEARRPHRLGRRGSQESLQEPHDAQLAVAEDEGRRRRLHKLRALWRAALVRDE